MGLWGNADCGYPPCEGPLPLSSTAIAERAEYSLKEMLSRAAPGHSKVVHHPHDFLRISFFTLCFFNSGYILWRNVKCERAVSVWAESLGAEVVINVQNVFIELDFQF